jgi:hypothetical protein
VKVWFVRADFKNPETAPYLRVNYVDTDGSHMSDKWQGFAGTPFEFDWIPGKAKKFELLRCNDGGATTPLVGKNTDDACVIDLIYDGVPSGSDEFEWKSGDNVVKLRVWMDDWGRARGISTFNKTNKVVEPPANCVELGKR